MINFREQRGVATLEMLIALVVIVLALSAVILVSFGGQKLSVGSQTNQEAIYRTKTLIENARALARQDFTAIKDCDDAGATKCNSPVDPFYSSKVTITPSADLLTKTVVAQTTWSSGQQVTLSTVVTDWQSALGGDTCNPTLTGDWSNPQLLGKADVGQNNGGTDVDVISNKAYVTADASSANKNDFYVVDISNPNVSNLPILGSVNTGPGLAAVRVAGKYAYVANTSTGSQLQVIDISNPNNPFVAASLDVTAAGDSAVGNSIYYSSKRVYLGLTKSSGPEFYVIDVSNPLNPLVKASFEINSQVNDIRAKSGIAYLAVPDDPSTSAIAEQLKVLDVSQADSGTITQINIFAPNPSTMSGEGLHLSKDGLTLYLGEGGANPGNKPDFFVLNVSNPASISVLNSKYIPTSNDVTVNAIVVRENLAFLWTSDTNLGFQIWDLNNLGNSTPYAALNTQQTATGGLDCDGNYLYTAQKSQKALQIIGPGP